MAIVITLGIISEPSVDVDQLEVLVEGQVQTVGKFHLIFTFILFQLLDRQPRIIHFQVISDGLRHQWGRHDALLAVDLCEIALLVELKLGTIQKHNVIALAGYAALHRGKCNLLVAEMLSEHSLCLGRESIYRDRLVAFRICHDTA